MPAELRTIPGVELVRVGTWSISTGEWEVTPADLAAAVTAHAAGVVRHPPIRLGHADPRFDGEPAIGHVDRLRVVDAGQVLVGDLVGVPAWLADGVLASAYPDRSVEGVQGFVDAAGQRHAFVLTGLALLGVTAPGVSTLRSLADVGRLYGVDVAASAGQRAVALRTTTPITATRRRVLIRAAATRRRHRQAATLLAALPPAHPTGRTQP